MARFMLQSVALIALAASTLVAPTSASDSASTGSVTNASSSSDALGGYIVAGLGATSSPNTIYSTVLIQNTHYIYPTVTVTPPEPITSVVRVQVTHYVTATGSV